MPAVTITDHPRFAWRGLLIDVGRHFIPLDVLKRNLDGMAAVKMNVLHLHLSDDQGFRVESKRFPKLHEMGSDGLYYTQNEIRELVSYAHDRGIRILPEFDTPGHSGSWFVGYPELASNPGRYTLEPGGIDSVTDPTQEATYKFLDKFIAEMAARHYAVDPMSGAAAILGPEEKTHPRGRSLHVDGMGDSREHRFAHLAAHRGHC